jgi:hypothetical protein
MSRPNERPATVEDMAQAWPDKSRAELEAARVRIAEAGGIITVVSGPAAEVDDADEFIHSHRCDYAQSGECYCPTPAEQAIRECGHLVDVECGCDE